jgi:uncharacterized protein YukE
MNNKFEEYKKETEARMRELQQSINRTAQTTNQNAVALNNMDDRIKNISKSVVNVDDRLANVETAINYTNASTDDKFNRMMDALGNLGGQMEKNNEAVAYLISKSENGTQVHTNNTQTATIPSNFLSTLFGKPTSQNSQGNTNDLVMSESSNNYNETIDESYNNNIDKADYQSGKMMTQTTYN